MNDGQILAPVISGLVTVHHGDGEPEQEVHRGLDGGVHLGGDAGLLPLLHVDRVEGGDQKFHVGGDRGAVTTLRHQLYLRGIARH